MKYWTWEETREKLENDLDLQESPEILASGELMGYVNDAIDLCEAYFIGLGDYFFAQTEISIVPGTKDYDLPGDIYATKIRKIFVDDRYELRELRNLRHIPAMKNISGDSYQYRIINNPGQRPKIRLFPTPAATGTMEIYYTRNARRLSATGGETQEIDVPEAMGLIFAYVKRRIYEKERSPLFQLYDAEVAAQRQVLEDALAQRIDDENNEIQPDTAIMDDHY